ncbi:MAG: serine hydrolase [Crocinitomicaceae bacterium]|nr:serine hydrolase [Crocinitomicaceae bacterium]
MLRFIKRFLIGLVALIGVAVLALLLTGNQHILYGMKNTYLIGKSKPDIDDLSLVISRKILADMPEPVAIHRNYNLRQLDQGTEKKSDSLETTALLVYKRDSLIFEKYWRGYTDTTHSNSFSMAKSFTAMMIGKAVEEGFINSLDQRVGDFLPHFREGKNGELTIRHLLQMASGIPFGESYSSPFGYMAKAYYGHHLEDETMKFNVEKTPGTLWVYEGGNTVLLGLIIKQATGKSPSEYFFQKFWSCIGAEHPAYWNIDSENGLEKTFSGFYATARDFARIGMLYEHRGILGNDTVLSPSFVDECLVPNNIPDSGGERCTWYGLHWWLGKYKGMDFFSCRGLRGQYIIVLPEKELIVVRLGHQQCAEKKDHIPVDLFEYLDAAVMLSGE